MTRAPLRSRGMEIEQAEASEVRPRLGDNVPSDFDWWGTLAPGGKPWERYCGARRKPGRSGAHRGLRCTLPAGWGTQHPSVGQCRYHFGNAQANVKSAEKKLAEREWLKMKLGDDPSVLTVDFMTACAEELQRSYNSVKILDAQVRTLAPEEWAGLTDSEEVQSSAVGTGTGATGRDTSQTTASVKRTARVHWWVDQWYRERKQLVSVIETANKIHLSARQMEFAEHQALAVADVFMATFSDPELALSEVEIDRMKRVAYKHLTQLPGPGGRAIEVTAVSGR